MLAMLGFALADLRGSLGRFVILLACLALGVGTIAMVGAVATSVDTALSRDGRVMLGGDLEARLGYRSATSEERAFLATLGTVSEAIDFVARPRSGDHAAFAMVRAVDEAYPLLGSVDFNGPATLRAALESRDGVPGALAGQALLDSLHARVGDIISFDKARFEVRGVLVTTPDEASLGLTIGAPLMISVEAETAADLLANGALSRYRYHLLLQPGVSRADAAQRIVAQFPHAGWQISTPDKVNEEFGRYYDLFGSFLVITGLSALLVGGIGVGNAVSAYVTDRRATIATLKSLGATRGRVLIHFLLQIGVLTAVGIAIGLSLGAVLALAVLPLLGAAFDLPLPPTLDLGVLSRAALFGALVSFVFSYLPLHRAQATPPAILFRPFGAPTRSPVGWRDYVSAAFVLPMGLGIAGLVVLASYETGSPALIFWYAIALGTAFATLSLSARLLRLALRAVPPLPDARIRNAIKAIYRPGTPAPAIMLSLGIGMALLVLIATIVNDLRHQLDPDVRVDAPNFVYMDLFEDEEQALAAFASSEPLITRYNANTVARSTAVSINGAPQFEAGKLTRDISMFFGDEQPLTEEHSLPDGNEVIAGAWWPSDYSGPPLVSPSEQMAAALNLKLGDQLTFAVAGDEVSATVASIRRYDWQKGRINFPLVMTPHALDAMPRSWFAFVRAGRGEQGTVQKKLDAQFPDLVYIPVDEALASALTLLTSIGNAVLIVGSVAIASGLLVLAGILTSRRRQREDESVVVKVLGATRRELIWSYLVEYGIVGLIAALIATALGVLGAWLFATRIVETRFSINPLLLLAVVGGAVLLTTAIGALTMWSSLSVKPAQRLRGD